MQHVMAPHGRAWRCNRVSKMRTRFFPVVLTMPSNFVRPTLINTD